ncbi:MAG TPA: hypothetical protein VGK67_14795 [Myxococcales bacterium]|jgi:hypothetical protein
MTTAKWTGAAMMAMALAGCGGTAADTGTIGQAASSGMPNGAHFNLNIIGQDNPKSQVDCGSGHVIFVPMTGTSKILLSEGAFSVLDCNGTDGSAAFQLPNPDPDGDGTTTYSVWARALGKPGGSASMTTCATDPATGEELCSLFTAVLVRSKGKSSFTNISKELLFVYADINGDGIVDRVPLFDSRLQDFFWNYQNAGLRLAQLRFYEVPTTVP